VHVVVQVIPRPPEAVVGHLPELEENVPGRHAGRLLALPGEANLAIAGHALFYVPHQRLFIRYHALAMAVGALCLEHCALAVALGAGLLHLHHKAGRHLLVYQAHTPPPAGPALAGLSILCPAALALWANNVAPNARLPLPAIVQVLQRNLHLHLRIRALAPPALLPTPKKHVKWAHGALVAAALLQALQALQALQVVHLLLLQVRQHLVGAGHLLKLLLRCLVTRVLVGVVL